MNSFTRTMLASSAIALAAFSAQARASSYATVDLTNYVNEGFTNAWFINGASFAPLDGTTTTGNQGSSVPFAVADPSDGSGSTNNFWFGLYSGPGTLSGPPGSFTVPVNGASATTVYTLADNVFGIAGNTEFSVTFTGTSGSITDNYVGAANTKDYNLNCATTGCDATPGATSWYDNGEGQMLQVVQWNLPANFGLSSITFNQIDGVDGAIVAGVTLGTAAVPEPATWGLMLTGFGLAGCAMRRRARTSVAYN